MKIKRIITSIAAVAFPALIAGAATERRDSVLTTSSSPGVVVSGEQLSNRPFGDVRNQLTGLVNGLEITEVAGGWYNSDSYESFIANSGHLKLSYRGGSSLTCFIDGLLVPCNIYVPDASQIESVTIVGDPVEMMRIGPMASNGALWIRTKGGGFNQPLTIRVSAEAGVAATALVPEWADGVDYALLNNQARANAGYAQLYSPLAIEGFLRNDPYDLQYPNMDYRKYMTGNLMPVSDASVSITGGGANVKYALTLGELYSGDVKRNNGNQDYNRVNISASVTARINRFMSVNVGFNSLLSFRREGKFSWSDWHQVPPVAYPLILGTNSSDEAGDDLAGLTIYGTSPQFPDNVFANLMEGGFSTRRIRSGMVFSNITMDFGDWVKGLKSETSLSYSTFVGTTISKSNDYLSYYWDASAEDGMGVISPTHQGQKASGKSISSTGANQLLQFKERLSWDWKRAGALLYDSSMQGVGYYRRLLQGFADAKYVYGGRYVAEGAFQYAGSPRFDRANRFRPFASAGVAWIASNESFLKDVAWIDFLKLRAQGGVLGQYSSAFGTEYLYQSNYYRANGYTYGPFLTLDTWFGNKTWNSQKTTITRIANPNLTWEKKLSWLTGLEFAFCKGFDFSATLYGYRTDGVISDISAVVPDVFGLEAASAYANYSSNSLLGYEVSLDWNRRFGDFSVRAGASIFHWDETYRTVVNDDYLYDYQKITGTSTGSVRGFECIGRFETVEQLETCPSYATPVLGDLMYKDQNGDGVIDTNDRVIIGNTQPDLRYSLRLGFGYKGLEVQAIATGQHGLDFERTSAYFWNGWGDGNYSAFVRDNIGGDYPVLSYVKSANNFVESDFWIVDGSWFKLQDVTLSYNIPLKKRGIVKDLSLKLCGQNLATITGVKYVDPEAPSSGVSSYPLFRTFTAGVKITF